MPSLFVPLLTKKPVPHPRPAILQWPAAGKKSPEMRALPSMMKVMGFSAVAVAIAALIRGASSVATPPLYLLRPLLRLQSRAQPISDARMYFTPETGFGGGAGPKQGIEKPPDSQPSRLQPKAAPTAISPLLKNSRLAISGLIGLCVIEPLGRLEAPFVMYACVMTIWITRGGQQNKLSRGQYATTR